MWLFLKVVKNLPHLEFSLGKDLPWKLWRNPGTPKHKMAHISTEKSNDCILKSVRLQTDTARSQEVGDIPRGLSSSRMDFSF
jgi:hypothetical protein